MKKTSKILSIILAILMIISIIPITASAATYSGTCGDNVTWTYDSSTYTLTISGKGDMYDYDFNNRPWESYEDKIKTVIIDDGVTTIGAFAFYSFGSVENIAILESITQIRTQAFYACDSLTSIILPDSVTTIAESSFGACDSLETVILSDNLTTIGDSAFAYSESLAEIVIPDSVTSIGKRAFCGCDSLITIRIPQSIVTIGERTFSLCDSLQSIIVNNNNPYYSSDEYGVLFNKDKSTLIQFPGGNTQTYYKIPDTVTEIVEWAFGHAYNLVSITIPDSVTTIGEHAFYYCSNLTDVKISNGVTDINDWTFGECDSLVTVTIPNSVTRIGNYAFYWSDNIANVIFGKNVTSIGLAAFNECTNITDIYYPGTINEWNEIAIEDGNEPILEANIHHNYHIHKYNAVVTAPTCTEQGYTTYTCECGESYVDDYVNATGHTPAEPVQQWPANPTCTENGSIYEFVYCADCGEELSRELLVIEATDHADNDGDGYCDVCNEQLENNDLINKIVGFIKIIINYIINIFS